MRADLIFILIFIFLSLKQVRLKKKFPKSQFFFFKISATLSKTSKSNSKIKNLPPGVARDNKLFPTKCQRNSNACDIISDVIFFLFSLSFSRWRDWIFTGRNLRDVGRGTEEKEAKRKEKKSRWKTPWSVKSDWYKLMTSLTRDL